MTSRQEKPSVWAFVLLIGSLLFLAASLSLVFFDLNIWPFSQS